MSKKREGFGNIVRMVLTEDAACIHIRDTSYSSDTIGSYDDDDDTFTYPKIYVYKDDDADDVFLQSIPVKHVSDGV